MNIAGLDKQISKKFVREIFSPPWKLLLQRVIEKGAISLAFL